MQLSAIICPTVRVEMQIQGGVTLTVFPISERWLRQCSDHQNAVREVRARNPEERFTSLMDYLFANVFPGTYSLVKAFYDNEGPPLREILTAEQCHMIDCVLVEALLLAYEDFCGERSRSWSKIRRTSDKRCVRKLLAA